MVPEDEPQREPDQSAALREHASVQVPRQGGGVHQLRRPVVLQDLRQMGQKEH